ncbi:protein FAM18B1-like [Tropilaelaps mercedesae]|uniref:Golgi apparatus membrane protein TVP23 homolog n=1 Tax=Tropilaelaps mercedesae TaxID=418985 RepID=A0A1V9XF68_9ACAR|nr:protein FAM18B1-like [Tropilaelaps mercedesae]
MMSNIGSPTASMTAGLVANEVHQNPVAPRHPFVVVAHVLPKGACVLYYLFCNFFNDSFVTNFVFLLFLIATDFWITKNISGRILVGLRWWSIVDPATGDSQYVFEKAPETRPIDKGEAGVFWTALLALPAVWGFFAFTAFLTFSFQWLTVIVVAVSLSTSNAYGYIRCRLGADKSIKKAASSWLGMQMFKNMFRRSAVPAQAPPAYNAPPSGSNI